MQTVAVAIEPLAAAKRLALTINMPTDLPVGHGDERRLAQVLLNLVGNAIKFTDSGEISMSATASNGAFTITVQDTGPGISEADQERIFAPFQQADSSSTRHKGGTGLGLSMPNALSSSTVDGSDSIRSGPRLDFLLHSSGACTVKRSSHEQTYPGGRRSGR